MINCSVDKQSLFINKINDKNLSEIKKIAQDIFPGLNIEFLIQNFTDDNKIKLINILDFLGYNNLSSSDKLKLNSISNNYKKINNVESFFKNSDVNKLFFGTPTLKNKFEKETNSMIMNAILFNTTIKDKNGNPINKKYVGKDLSVLNKNIRELKNQLFKDISEHLFDLNLLSDDILDVLFDNGLFKGNLYDLNGSFNKNVYETYKKVINISNSHYFENANRKFISNNNIKIPVLNANSKSKSDKKDISNYIKTVFLVNFDNIVKNKFENLIKIDPLVFNDFDVAVNRAKYSFLFQGDSVDYWLEDDHMSEDASRIETDLTKQIIGSIPRKSIINYTPSSTSLENNGFLSINDVYGLGAMINGIELESLNYLSNLPGWEPFVNNPVKMLNWYLNKIKDDYNSNKDILIPDVKTNTISDNLRNTSSFFKRKFDVFLSIKSFLDQLTEQEKNSDNLISTIISHVMINTYGATYGNYNVEDGSLTTLELHSHNADAVSIQNSIYSHLYTKTSLPNTFNIIVKGDVLNYSEEKSYLEKELNNSGFLSKFIESKLGIYLPVSSEDKLKRLKKWSDKNGNISNSVIAENLIGILNNIRTAGADNKNLLQKIISHEVELEEKSFGQYAAKSDIISPLTKNGHVQDIIDLALELLPTTPITTVEKSTGDKIPTFKLHNLMYDDVKLLHDRKLFELNNPNTKYKNLLLSTSSILGTLTKLELQGVSSKDASKWNTSENFDSNFLYDFLYSLHPDSKMPGINIIIGAYSDKSTILSKLINKNVIHNDKRLIQGENVESIKGLKTIYRFQMNDYYKDLLNYITESYKFIPEISNKLTLDVSNNISVINDFLSSFSSKNELLSKLKEITLANPNVEFIEEIHYSLYLNDSNKSIMNLNKSILHAYTTSLNESAFNEFYNSELNKLVNDLSEYKNNILISNTHISKWNKLFNSDNIIDDFYNLLGLSDSKRFNSDKGFLIKNESNEINPLLEKWFLLNNLFKSEYQNLSAKSDYVHSAKKLKLLGDINLEFDGRFKNASKRNVQYISTTEVSNKGLQKGLPNSLNFSVIQDATDNLHSIVQESHKQDIYDGSSFMTYITSKMLEESYKGKGYSGTKKQFGVFLTTYSSAVKKDAEFIITNNKMLKSLKAETSLYNINKKALSAIEINQKINNPDSKISTNFIKNGKKYTISDIKFTYENGVNKMVYFLKENNNKPFITSSEVKTLFNIWEILGGIYTTDKTFKNFTEDSNEALYELITSKNNDFLKSSFIHVISNQSAFKSGAANVNLADSWKNKDDKLSYFTRDISFYGPQLDAKHEADASKIKEITQIISAASQNYKTAHIAMEMYEDLANIINKAIKPYEDAIKGDNKDFGKYIASKLISSVSNDDRGDIVVALSNILGLENLPFSEQTFFPHLVRNLISKMNSDFITRKYPGLGAVLNPSHKIIQIYEDSLGNIYTMDSLVKKALLNNTEEGLTNEQIVDNYINNYFKDELTTVDKVFIGQHIKVIDEQNNITIIDLNSPLKYIEFKEAYENDSSKSIYIIRNIPRDLKPEETSFNYEGKQMNLFDLDSVILRAALENYINISKSNLISEVKTELPINNWKYKSLEQFSQLMGLEFNLLNENTTSKLFDLLKKWTQRNLDFIEENKLIKRIDKFNPSVKDVLTLSNGVIDNFELRFREVNKLYNAVPITDYTFKQAELIGGNIYNSLFNIGLDDVSDIKNDPNYFLNKINNLLVLDERQADFKITTDEQNTTVYVKIVNELPPYKKYSNVVKSPEIFGDEFQNNIVRLNDKGEPLYVLPKNSVVELKDGIDIVYIKLGEFNKKENKTKIKPGELRNLTNFVKSFSTINSFLPILNNSIDLDFLNDKGEIVNVRNVIGNEFRKIYNLPVMTDNFTKEFFENKLPEIKNSIANKQRASWEKSLEFLVARIPSQSTQSFMPMKTVGYLGANSNDVYVSVYQLMIQGSDLDIDKAYLMGYSFNKAGKYEIWTDNLDYNNKEELDQLEKLPMPSNKMIITDNSGIDLSSYDLEFETLLNSDKFDSGTLKSENSQIYINQIKLLKTVLNLLKESNYKTSLSSNSNLFKFINNYNASKNYLKIKGALNNSIVSKLQQIISTPSVRILANTPVEVESIRTAGKNANKNKIDKLMSPYSTLSYLEQTEEAAVGKDDVGVGANGSKVFYALSNYYNNTLKNIIFNSDEEYVTHPAVFSKNIQIGDKNYNIGSVSDVDLSESFIRTTINFYGEQVFDRKLTLLESNAALAISGFISGATDNAKELVMAKINATVTLAKIHLYMLSLGIPINDVAVFMKSPVVELIIANLKTNLVNDESFKSVEKVVSDILTEDKSLERELNQFLSVYNGAIEFSNMASIFGVNQKMSANVGEIFKFFNKIETSLFIREKTLFTRNINKLKLENKSDETFIFNSILKNNVLYNSYYNKLESNEKDVFKNKILNIIKEAYALGIAGGSFNVENYLSEDENYKNVTVKYYNLIKDTFNIFDVINKSPHYSAMLKGVYTTNNTLKYLSKKYKFVFEDVKKIANDSNIKTAFKNNNSGVISNVLNSSSFPIAYNDDTISRASTLYDKLVISNWLKKENPFIINVNNLLKQANIDKIDLYESDEAKYYPEKVAKKLKGVIKTVSVNDSEDTLLYLTSDHDLANFRLLVEQVMLPILKESKNSDLGKYLILSTVKNSLGGFSPQLISKFPLSNLNNPYNGAKFSEILYHFNLIDEKIESENKIKSSNGKILQWKDILYLYNLIVNNGSPGNKRLTSLFINYSQINDSLAVKYAKYYKDIDNGNENISDNLSKDLVLYWVFNKRGNLNVPFINDKNELEIKSVFIKNPNFTILSSIDQSKQLVKDNLEKANKILSNILSKNLIINYNCD